MSRPEAFGIESYASVDRSDPNYVIAKAIQPKLKGWAWHRRTGQPIDFSDPKETTALVNWAQHQPWWQMELAEGRTTHGQYVHLAMEAAEKNAGPLAVSSAVRTLIVTAIKKYGHA